MKKEFMSERQARRFQAWATNHQYWTNLYHYVCLFSFVYVVEYWR